MPGVSAGVRRLAGELRRLRESAGLTQDQVANETGISKTSLFRLENARTKPRRQTVVTLLKLYEADSALREHLIDLYEQLGQLGWLTRYHDALPGEYSALIQFEAEATSVRHYESLLVPGLLQTEAYARAVMIPGQPELTADEIEKRVGARMERQRLLHKENPLRLSAVVDEAVLRRVVGGHDAMQEQLRRLVHDAELPNVTLQVIPFGVGAHGAMTGSFRVLSFSAQPDVIYLDSANGDVVLDNQHDSTLFTSTFDELCSVALTPEESADLIQKVVNDV